MNKSIIQKQSDDVSMETPLACFINARANAYSEPSRKNTPRGKKIGLSSRKYYATLLFLYNLKLKDVVAKANVSYGVLKVWRTEQGFQNAVKQNYFDFAAFFINRLSEVVKEGKINFPHFKKNENDDDLTIEPMPVPEIKEFVDMQYYNPRIIAHIGRCIHIHVNGLLRTDTIEALDVLLTYSKLRYYCSQESLIPSNKIHFQHYLHFLITWLQSIQGELKAAPFDEATLNKIVTLLSWLNSNVRDLD